MFLKLSEDLIINSDQIVDAQWFSGVLSVSLAVTESDNGAAARFHRIEGFTADRLWSWLYSQGVDLSVDPTPEDQQYAEYQARGGTLIRKDWDRKHETLRANLQHKDGKSELWSQAHWDCIGRLEQELIL